MAWAWLALGDRYSSIWGAETDANTHSHFWSSLFKIFNAVNGFLLDVLRLRGRLRFCPQRCPRSELSFTVEGVLTSNLTEVGERDGIGNRSDESVVK